MREPSSRRCRNLQIQRLHHFQNGNEFWVSFGAQRFVEAFAREARFARHFSHAFCADHCAERERNEFSHPSPVGGKWRTCAG